MSPRHILSIADLEPADIDFIVRQSVEIAGGHSGGVRPLAGKAVGIYFRKTSTRTRTSFTVGAGRLGATIVTYGPHDLQTNTGETIEDTARVLSGYLDALVVRTAESLEEMKILAAQNRMAVINAMSENEHPTQALADLSTLAEHFGELENIEVLYIGEGNNTATALALACSRIRGAKLAILTPPHYGIPREVLQQSQRFADDYGADVRQYHDMEALPGKVDVVYTTRWQTTGTTKADPNWKESFNPFKVTKVLLDRLSKPSRTVFMHDLPAVRGEEVDAEVLDGPQSIAFRQAEHKLFSAMAGLTWCILGRQHSRGHGAV
jgi:ornithine carbamoyltransferase